MINKKRYRVQIELDVHAETDKEAVATISDLIHNMQNTNNERVISFVEQPFASLAYREIPYIAIGYQLEYEEITKANSSNPNSF